MSDGFDHQDWKEVKFSGAKSSTNENKMIKKQKGGLDSKTRLENSIDYDEEGSMAQKKVTMDFRIALQKARLAKKMSQADLAKRCCIPAKRVNEYESGKAVPNQNEINKLRKVLGVNLSNKK